MKDRGEESVASTERESGRIGSAVGGAETSGQLPEWCRLQQKSLNALGFQNRQGDISVTKKAVGKDVRAFFAN